MKINVTENKVSIKEEQILNENEYNIHKIQFDFSSEYTDDLVKVALFSIDNHTYKKIISNNECDIPPEVLTQRGYSILGVYAYKTEQDTLVLRYSPSPTKISVYDGSYKADAENSEPITPSEIEQYQQILQNSLQQFQNQYNALVEETEGDIQAIEDELQRKVDEGYFDGEDGFSPIATVTQLQNGARIEIEDKNGRTSVDVLNGQDGYSPVRGVDYWTEEDKQEVEEEATQQIDGKIEEYNTNAQNKLNQYNSNATQKTTDYNTNAEQKMSAYNTNATEKTSTYNSNATEKFNNYNSNAEQKETNYNTNASQKVESFNTNASSKLSEYNSNAETKKSAYDENATQKTNSFNTNATNKLTEYNTNHTEKMSAYNSNSTQKLNAFNENATQKTEDFDEHTEEIQDNIETLEAQNERLRNTLPTTTAEGKEVTLNKTAELEFKKPPLPMGNSEQVQYSGKNLLNKELFVSTNLGNWEVEQIENGIRVTHKNNYSTGVPTVTVQLKPNTTYTYSQKQMTGFSIIEDGGSIKYPTTGKATLTTGNLGTITITIVVAENTTTEFTYMQLEEGSTATSYEPYTNGASPNPDYPQEITNVTGDVEVVVRNKNLFDETQLLQAEGWTVSNGIYSGIIDNWFAKFKNGFTGLSFETNTQYTISLKGCTTGGTPRIKVVYMDGTSSILVINATSMTEYSLTSTFGKTVSSIQADFGSGSAQTLSLTKFQIEQGSTSTDYVEHKQQTFTFPLGNEKLMLGDYLADDGIHHVRGQVDLSTLIWNINSFPNQNNTLCLSGSYNQSKSKQGQKSLLCNRFKEQIQYSVDNEGIDCYTNGYGFTLRILKSRLSEQTAIGVNTWLQANLSIVEFELAEELIIPYTSVQQEVYNQIKQAISYEEQTNISSNTIALFNVEAYQDAKVILAEKGTYSKPSTGIPKTDLESAVQTSLNKADSAIQEHQDISGKQDITDNTLTTINKTVPTAINEVNSIAKLANQAKSYSTYQAFINYLNTAEKTEFIPGQSFMIQTKLVPDLWVYSVENTSVQYTYTTDEDFITYTNQATGGQVGYYKLAQLETQKVDLTDYATKTYVNNLFNSIVDGDEVSY